MKKQNSKTLINSLLENKEASFLVKKEIIEKDIKRDKSNKDINVGNSILKEIQDMDNNINNINESYKNYDSQLSKVLTDSKIAENFQAERKQSIKIKEDKDTKVLNINQKVSKIDDIEVNTKLVLKKKCESSLPLQYTQVETKEILNISDKNNSNSELSTSSKSITKPELKKRINKPTVSKKFDSDYEYDNEMDCNDYDDMMNLDYQKNKSDKSPKKNARKEVNPEVFDIDQRPSKYKAKKTNVINLNDQKSKNDYIADKNAIFNYNKPKLKNLKYYKSITLK